MGTLLNRRRYMGGKTLPYDAEIEYLEVANYNGTNPVTVSFGIPFAYGRGFGCTFSHLSCIRAGNAWSAFMGTQYTSTRAMLYVSSQTIAGLDWLNSAGGSWQNISGTDIKTVEVKRSSSVPTKSILTYNGGNPQTKNNFTPTSTYDTNIIRFIPYEEKFNCRLYRFWIYDDDNSLLLDAIPVRIGQVGYLYDRVSGQLFDNESTGSFTLGPDKN